MTLPTELELPGVEDRAVIPSNVEGSAGPVKLCLDAVIMDQCIVYASLHSFLPLVNPVHPVSERVSTADEALRGDKIPETSPWSDERRYVLVILGCKANGVISVPVVEDSLVRVTGHIGY